MRHLAALLCLLSAPAMAQTTPNVITGQIPTAAQWNSYFGKKADVTGGTITNGNLNSPTLNGNVGGSPSVGGVWTSNGASLNGFTINGGALSGSINATGATITSGTINATDLGLGVVTATPGTATQLPLGKLVGNVGATANPWCWVGDSITEASTNPNTMTISASGGTAPYAFNAVTGLPANIAATVGTTAILAALSPAWPGGSGASSTITVSVTDNVGATGSQQFILTYNIFGQMTLTPTGPLTGTVALAWTGQKVQDSMRGPSVWSQILTNTRIISPQTLNFGHSGDKTTDVLARISAIVSANCAGYVVLIGTNDLVNTGSPAALATLEANLSSIWSQLLATGRPVVAMTILPRNLAQPANANTLDMLWAVDRYIRRQRGTINNLYVVDAGVYYGDPLSATATPRVGATADYNYSYDGLHPTSIGSFFVSAGQVTAAAPAPLTLTSFFNQRYPDPGYKVASVTDLYSAGNLTGNLLTNGLMDFSGGTGTVTGRATGVAPDGWKLTTIDNSCSPCTFVVTGSRAALADGTQAAQFVFSGTAGGGFATEAILSWSTTSFTNYSIGDKLQASCRFEVDNDTLHVTPPNISLFYTTGPVGTTLATGTTAPITPAVSDGSPQVAYSGTLSTPLPAPALVGGLSGTLTFSIIVYVTNGGSHTVGGTFRVSACRMEKIP